MKRVTLLVALVAAFMAVFLALCSSAGAESSKYITILPQDIQAGTEVQIVISSEASSFSSTADNDLTLFMETPQSMLRYEGDLSLPLVYKPSYSGVYTVILQKRSSLQELDRLSFQVSAPQPSSSNQTGNSTPQTNATAIAQNSTGSVTGNSSNGTQGVPAIQNSSEPTLVSERIMQVLPLSLSLGQTVFIQTAHLQASDTLLIAANGTTYKYVGEVSPSISFVPQMVGEYVVQLVDVSGTLQKEVLVSVLPLQLQQGQQNQSLVLNASNGTVNNGIEGNLSGNETQGNESFVDAAVQSQLSVGSEEVLLGDVLQDKQDSFKSRRQEILVSEGMPEEDKARALEWIDRQVAVEQNLQLLGIQRLNFWIHDYSGSLIDVEISLGDSAAATQSPSLLPPTDGISGGSEGGSVFVPVETVSEMPGWDSISAQLQNFSNETSLKTLSIRPKGSQIKRIVLDGVNASSPVSVGLEEIFDPSTPAEIAIQEKSFVQSYAFDPAQTDFTQGFLTVEAKGTELYKCKEWNFSQQSCSGSWTKILDMVPGQNYTILLSPEDPGFGETIPIPSLGWDWYSGSEIVTVFLCKDYHCTNTSTNFQPSDIVFMTMNNSGGGIQINSANVFDIYEGGSTSSSYAGSWSCEGASPYPICRANFTVDQGWDGWYYIDSDMHRASPADYHLFKTAFIVGEDSLLFKQDALKFYADANFTIETESFPEGSVVFVEWNLTSETQVITTNTVPLLNDFQDTATGGTAITESIMKNTTPYRFNFTFPNVRDNYWYYLQPRLRNSTSGAVPDGSDVHGRIIRDRANNLPLINSTYADSNYTNKKSVGETITYFINFTDAEETNYHKIFICSTNSATRIGCTATTLCSVSNWTVQYTFMNCTRAAIVSDPENTTSYAFACDPFNCSVGRSLNWSVFNDTSAPTVSLQEPINNPNPPLDSYLVTFRYIPVDNYGMPNCSLYTNATGSWVVSSTNFSIANNSNNYFYYTFPSDGSYKWNVQCYDYAGNPGWGSANLTFSIFGPPIVSLITPANSGYSNSFTPTFNYNVTHRNNISNCSIYINNALNYTNSTILRNVVQNFTAAFSSDQTLNWSVACTDNESLSGYSSNWSFSIDTTSPVANLMSPGNNTLSNSTVVTFNFNASDASNSMSCTLYVDNDAYETFNSVASDTALNSIQILPNGYYPWYASCTDPASNSGTSGTFYINVSSNDSTVPAWYETNLGQNVNYTATAGINLSFAIDSSQNKITKTVSAQSPYHMANAYSSVIGANGLLITANQLVNFSGVFTKAGSGTGYITWRLLRLNGSTETTLCNYGDDSTGGVQIPANTNNPTTYQATCTISSLQRLSAIEQVGLRVTVYNNRNAQRVFTHYFDNLNSFTYFNFTGLGFLTTELISPVGTVHVIKQNESVPMVCQYRCSQGTCLNVSVYAEYNVTSPITQGWRNISATGTLILNGTETNPHTFSVVTQGTFNTTFYLFGLNYSENNVRCTATSIYTDKAVGNITRVINVSDSSDPTIQLNSPSNNSYHKQNVTFIYIPADATSVANCSIFINGQRNQTNFTVTNNFANNFTVRMFPEGSYNWSINCTDPNDFEGHSPTRSFIIDSIVPHILLSVPPYGQNFTASIISFNFTASDAVSSQLKCDFMLDSTVNPSSLIVNSGVAYNFSKVNISIGNHYWNVTCLDNATNSNTSGTFFFNITDLAPTVSLFSPNNSFWNPSSNISLVYNYTDNGPALNCSLFLNNAFNTTNQTPVINGGLSNFTMLNMQDGRYVWNVSCTDSGGLKSAGINRTFYIDTTQPTIALSAPFPNETLSTFLIPFNFTVTDNLAPSLLCNLTIDGSTLLANFTALNGSLTSKTPGALNDGFHRWNVTCVDNASNSNTSLTRNFTIFAPPTVNLISPANDHYNNTGNLTFTYNVSENAQLFNCSLLIKGAMNQTNSSAQNNATNTFRVQNISEGRYNWSVQCYDNSSLLGTTTTRNFTVDMTLPNILPVYPASGLMIRNSTVFFNFTAFDNADLLMSCSLYLDDVLKASGLSSPNGTMVNYTLINQPDGAHTWNANCTDDANNRNGTAKITFNVSAPPQLTLNAPANNSWNNTGALALQYTPYHSTGLKNCSLTFDGAFNHTNSSITNNNINTFVVSGVLTGVHNWSVYCIDNTNGNVTSDTWFIKVDRVLPNMVLNAPSPNETWRNNYVNFNFTAYDNMGTPMNCSIAANSTTALSGILAPNATPVNATALLHGGGFVYGWNVTCRDNASNINTSFTQNFTLTAPPGISLVSPSDTQLVGATVVLNYIPVDHFNLSNCSLIVSGIYNATNYTILNNAINNFTLTNVTDGVYTWAINCSDVDLDTNQTAPRTFVANTVPPNVQLFYPVNFTFFDYDNVTFNFTSSDDNSTNITCNISVDNIIRASGIVIPNGGNASRQIAGFADGTRYWNVTCYDQVLNPNSSITETFNVSRIPWISLSRPANNSWNNTGNLTFGFIPLDNDGFRNCTVFINGTANTTNSSASGTIRNGALSNISVAGFSDGYYNWSIQCFDNGTYANSNQTSVWNFWIDRTPPNIILHNATQGQAFNVSSVMFNWTFVDGVSPNGTCSLQMDNTTAFSGIAVLNNTAVNRSVSAISDGTHFWNVTCFDFAGNSNFSATRDFTVQEKPRVALYSPANNSVRNSSSVQFQYVPTDNSNAFANCSLLIDGTLNARNFTVVQSVVNNITGTGIIDGYHSWNVNCTDISGNWDINASPRTVIVDTVPPGTELNFPAPNETISFSTVTFNWTSIDTLSFNITCNLTIDSNVSAANSNLLTQNNTPYVKTVENFTEGTHFWNVTCWDWANNTNISSSRNFTIPPIDLSISPSDILFSTLNPDYNTNITISANVYNIGGGNPYNITVDFWDGHPDTGTKITNRTIASLPGGTNITLTTSWNITLGLHEVFVIVDPANFYSAETSELNNNASRNISTLFANITYPPNSTWFSNETVFFNFTVANFTGGSLNYTFYVNSQLNVSGTASDNINTRINLTFNEGTKAITVEAVDGIDGLSRKKNSSRLTIYVDLSSPQPSITTLNQSWFNTGTPTISFTITDTVDTMLNYTFYASGSQNRQGNVSSGAASSVSLLSLGNGTYILVLEAFDEVLHYANSTAITIYIDTVPPSIQLNSPESGFNTTSRRVMFNFTAFDNMDPNMMCNLTVDSIVRATIDSANGTAVNYSVGSLSEAVHYWNVTCIDNATNVNFSETRPFNVFASPNITLINPSNSTWSNNVTNVFTFNVSEETGLQNCSLFLNDTLFVTKNNTDLTINQVNNFTLAGLEGTYDWQVECYDNTSFSMYSNSSIRRFYVDRQNPQPYILTANNSNFNTATPLISFNITDNMDAVLNYSFYANGALDRQGITNSSAVSNATLLSLADGYYNITLQGLDEAYNAVNSTPISVLIDTSGPNIALNSPANGNQTPSDTINFNFTATDTFWQNLVCNLTVTGYGYSQGLNATSGAPFNMTLLGISSGLHWWNVTCLDGLNNSNTSLTYNFTIPVPDIVINATGIVFSNNNPREFENITINATVFNVGSVPAYNFTVQFFVEHPENGTQINGNITISSLEAGNSTIASVNWSAIMGQNRVYAFADAPYPNGIILETNENNNFAFQYITVGSWHFVGGVASGALELADIQNFSAYVWEASNLSSSNLYVTKESATISWTQLKALSRNATGGYDSTDFDVLDARLNISSWSDSVNRTYTSGGSPVATRNYTIYSKTVNDIPVANSTNVSSFLTGILWDTADGNTSYNGSQDIIFMTRFNPGQQGFNGTFDYEIRIPATLRQYNGAGSTVAFYLELR